MVNEKNLLDFIDEFNENVHKSIIETSIFNKNSEFKKKCFYIKQEITKNVHFFRVFDFNLYPETDNDEEDMVLLSEDSRKEHSLSYRDVYLIKYSENYQFICYMMINANNNDSEDLYIFSKRRGDKFYMNDFKNFIIPHIFYINKKNEYKFSIEKEKVKNHIEKEINNCVFNKRKRNNLFQGKFINEFSSNTQNNYKNNFDRDLFIETYRNRKNYINNKKIQRMYPILESFRKREFEFLNPNYNLDIIVYNYRLYLNQIACMDYIKKSFKGIKS